MPTEEIAAAVETFFRRGVAHFIAARTAATVDAINARLAGVDLRGVASATAPFIETVALHQWARKREVLPILLPHSWTSSHEFPAATYRAALTVVKSDLIMPSASDDADSLGKEEVVDLARVAALHASKSAEAPVAMRPWQAHSVRAFRALPMAQKLRVAPAVAADSVAARVAGLVFPRRVREAGLRIGYLLNYEHYEFNAAVEIGRFFRFVVDLAADVASHSSDGGGTLIVRKKPGWTNFRLMRHVARSRVRTGTLLESPGSLSLEAFGAMCDVVLYTQATSAVPELMSYGTPVIELSEPTPTLLVDQYVVIPNEVVPRLSLADTMRLLPDGGWVDGLARAQRDWVQKQMVTS